MPVAASAAWLETPLAEFNVAVIDSIAPLA
jgi:hypothetical protein